ncbi:MAG: hypothetical protein COB30_007170 [Ectothiorhodospiraceae bacterium]|nr:hypothetical protein [Ectothiorhodospiraceae bacterium]
MRSSSMLVIQYSLVSCYNRYHRSTSFALFATALLAMPLYHGSVYHSLIHHYRVIIFNIFWPTTPD